MSKAAVQAKVGNWDIEPYPWDSGTEYHAREICHLDSRPRDTVIRLTGSLYACREADSLSLWHVVEGGAA